MLRVLFFIAIVAIAPAGAAHAQTVGDGITQMLKSQGFSISSTRYTWLRRIAIQATNGVYLRDLLVSRGANVILQDEWHLIDTSGPAPSMPAPPHPESRARPIRATGRMPMPPPDLKMVRRTMVSQGAARLGVVIRGRAHD